MLWSRQSKRLRPFFLLLFLMYISSPHIGKMRLLFMSNQTLWIIIDWMRISYGGNWFSLITYVNLLFWKMRLVRNSSSLTLLAARSNAVTDSHKTLYEKYPSINRILLQEGIHGCTNTHSWRVAHCIRYNRCINWKYIYNAKARTWNVFSSCASCKMHCWFLRNAIVVMWLTEIQ